MWSEYLKNLIPVEKYSCRNLTKTYLVKEIQEFSKTLQKDVFRNNFECPLQSSSLQSFNFNAICFVTGNVRGSLQSAT